MTAVIPGEDLSQPDDGEFRTAVGGEALHALQASCRTDDDHRAAPADDHLREDHLRAGSYALEVGVQGQILAVVLKLIGEPSAADAGIRVRDRGRRGHRTLVTRHVDGVLQVSQATDVALHADGPSAEGLGSSDGLDQVVRGCWREVGAVLNAPTDVERHDVRRSLIQT
jgi:hypothetical protein